MSNETTNLLPLTPSTPTKHDIGISRPPSRTILARPPLVSVGSSQSLKSPPSAINDTYELNQDSLSMIDFQMYNRTHHYKNDLYSYLSYYIPILNWLPNYNYKQSLIGDLLAGSSLASFQIPLVMSIAISLAHLPPISGLYAMIIGAMVYAIFGTVPILIVGPSPSTAVIYGQAIEAIRHQENYSHYTSVEISSCLTFGLSGILLACGFCRLGYLDNVLSRALLKGFIAAMGLIMIINQLSTELGLDELADSQPHITTIDKLIFIIQYYHQAHHLTFLISSISLIIVLSIRFIKSKLVVNHKSVVYFPELLLMIVLATFFCHKFNWVDQGVEIIGDIANGSKSKLQLQNPFKLSHFKIYKHTFTTFFLCTILGYFDSITAVKALGAKYNYNVSSNRELIALGAINFINGLFMGIPSFGAFGRSKLNISAGATSPMAGIFMSIASIITVVYLLPYLYYLPQCVLALTTTIIGITVLVEIPSDLRFFWNIGGFDELLTFTIIFLLTIFWSAEAGVSVGVIIAIIRVIKHSSKSRIQILGRVPNTLAFRDLDALIEESFLLFQQSNNEEIDNLIAEIEEIEHVLIIKIPEPLNFTNVNDLKNKLARIERYGTLLIHPSQPSIKDIASINTVVFDCKGMNKIDSSALQVLYEIVARYVAENILVLFSRVSTSVKLRDQFRKSRIIDLIHTQYNENTNLTTASGLGSGFYLSIDEALKSIERNNV